VPPRAARGGSRGDGIMEDKGDLLKMRQVLIYLGEDSYWVAECPSLPGCISQGKTKEEAIVNIKEAIQKYIAALEEDNLPVPEEHFEALLLAV
jgi:predicted RNase H-like HicB family nuclease